MDRNQSIDKGFLRGIAEWFQFEEYLKNKNRFTIIPKWEELIKCILNNIQTKKYEENKIFYRARIGCEKNNRGEPSAPLSWESIGIAPLYKTKGARANPPGIQHIYVSPKRKTAIAEVRPYKEAIVSIGQYKLVNNITLVDITEAIRNIDAFSKGVWAIVHNAFSVPCSPDNEGIEYTPTQYLSERFRLMRYDGIAYESSLYDRGENVVIFDDKKIKPIKRYLFEVTKVNYDSKQFFIK